MSKEANEARSRMIHATFERKEHFRLYKSGKLWVFAGIFALSTAIGLSQTNDVSAATTDQTTVATNTDKDNQASTVALQSAPAQSAASTAAPAGKTVTTAAKSATAAPAPAPAAADDTTAQDTTAPDTTAPDTTGTDNYAQSQKDLQDAANAATDAGLTVTKDPDATVETDSANVQADAQKVADSTADTIAQLQAATEKQEADNKAYDDSVAAREGALSGAIPTVGFTDDQIKNLLGDDITKVTVVQMNEAPTAVNAAAQQADAGGTLEDGAQWIYKGAMVDAKTGRKVDVVETVSNIQPATTKFSPMLAHSANGTNVMLMTRYVKSLTYSYQYLDSETQEPVSLDAFFDLTAFSNANITFDNGDAENSLEGSEVTKATTDNKQTFSTNVDTATSSSIVWLLQKDSQGTAFTIEEDTRYGDETLAFGANSLLPPIAPKTIEDPSTYPASYQLTNLKITTQYTVNYTGGPDGDTKVSKPVVWTSSTAADGTITYTPNVPSVTTETPAIEGYTADKATVFGENLIATSDVPSDKSETVTYSKDTHPASLTLTIHDDTTGINVGSSVIQGNLGDLMKHVTATGPSGMKLSDVQPDSNKFTATMNGTAIDITPKVTFTADDSDNFTIHVEHVIDQMGTPTDSTDPYYKSTHKTFKVDVTGVAPDGISDDVTPDNGQQTFVASRTWAYDEATGAAIFSAWQPAENAPQTITAAKLTGYTPSVASIAAKDLAAKVNDFVANSATADGSYTDTITYKQDATDQIVNIHYVYKNVDGSELQKTLTLTGKSGDTYSFDIPATIAGPNDDAGAKLDDDNGKLDTTTLYYYATADLNGGQYNTLADDSSTDGQFGTTGQDVWVMYVAAQKAEGSRLQLSWSQVTMAVRIMSFTLSVTTAKKPMSVLFQHQRMVRTGRRRKLS